MTRLLARVALIVFLAPVVIASALFAGGIETTTSRNTSRYSSTTDNTASPDYDSETRLQRDKMVKALDSLRSKVEEWGVVTISAPVAVLNPRAFYVPNDIVPPAVAYNSARTDVEASAVQATEVGIGNQFTGVVTPTIIPPVPTPPRGGSSTQTTTTNTTVSAPPSTAAGSPTGTATTPGPTATPAENLEVAPAASASTFGFKELAAPFALGPSGMPTPTKSVAAALREAQDNTMRQNIYTEMSYPNGIEDYNRVIFAIVEVSCNPGWRTKEHYIAECSASLEYDDLRTREHLSLAEERAPTVFSVLPLLDAQTVEMANSQREVTQLAFQLAASLPAHGANIRAKDLFQFVRRYSRDLRSRTPIPVVNSFSSGSTFGFRFSPSFQAMRDPAQKNARAGNVLLPTSFPALITVVMHDEDRDVLKENGFTKPGILTHVSTRWFLKDRPPLWQLPKRLFTPMRRDTANMGIRAAETVATFYLEKDKFETTGTAETGKFNPMYEEARRNMIALQDKGIGRDWPISLSGEFLQAKKDADAKMRDHLERLEGYTDSKQELDYRIQELQRNRQLSEIDPAAANIVSISMTDENGKGKTIKFDKRPFGDISGDKLADLVGRFLTSGGTENSKPTTSGESPTPTPSPTGTPKPGKKQK